MNPCFKTTSTKPTKRLIPAIHPLLCFVFYFLLLPFYLLLFTSPLSANPTLQSAARHGIDLFLNEEYTRSHAAFDSLIIAYPDRPEGYLGKAMAYWDESLIRENEKQYDEQIRNFIGQAIQVSENDVKAQGESAETFFWLGSAYGLRSGQEMMRGNVIEGILDGLKGREFLQESVRIDPNMVDAYFGLGLSDYIIARKPHLMRMVSRLFSLPAGDREGGIAQLDRVAREGIYTQRHAISSRAFIELYYEKDYENARRRFAEIKDRYPHSLDYRLRYLDALFGLTIQGNPHYHQALIDSAQSIRSIAAQRNWNLDRWSHTKLYFIEGLGNYLTGQLEPARENMETYVREAPKKSWLLGPAELTLGKLADLRNNRSEAIAHYRRAHKHEDVWGARTEAETWLKRPFTGTEPQDRPPDTVRRYPEQP